MLMGDDYLNNFFYRFFIIPDLPNVELAWRSGSVMDCQATAWGSIPSGNGVRTELHVLCMGQ